MRTPSFLRRPVSRYLFALLIGFVGAFVAYDLSGRRQWTQYESEVRRRGGKLDILELVSTPAPGGIDIAALALVKNTAEANQGLGFQLPDHPAFGGCDRRAIFDPVHWRDYFVRQKWITERNRDHMADLRMAIARTDAATAELELILRDGNLRFPVKWEEGFNSSAAGKLVQIGELLRLRATIAFASGDSPAALREVKQILRLREAAIDQPSLICGLVLNNLVLSVVDIVWEGTAANCWSDAELQELERALAGIDVLRSLRWAFESERGLFNRTMTGIAKRDPQVLTHLSPNSDGSMWLAFTQGWLRRSQVRTNRYLDDLIAQIHPEQRTIDRSQSSPHAPQVQASWLEQSSYSFFYLSAPIYGAVEDRAAFAALRVEQARTACALQRYYRKHGQSPERLEELVPEFLTELPHEVFSREPLLYRPAPNDGRILLYSRGLNGVDDGGSNGLSEENPTKTVSPRDMPDWVWSYLKGHG